MIILNLKQAIGLVGLVLGEEPRQLKPTCLGHVDSIQQFPFVTNGVQCILADDYEIPLEEAAQITQTFLTNFRRFPENLDYSLAEWREMLWRQALGETYHEIAEEISRQWVELRYEHLQPDDGVLSMLRCLKTQYLLALITNGTSRSQWEKIYRLELQEYFHTIIVSGDLCWEKPSKAIFLLACEQLDVHPSECIMVGDRLDTDVLGARNANLGAVVWVPVQETRDTQVQVTPDASIDHVTLLPALLTPARPDLGRYLNLSEPESENSNCSETS